MSSPYEPASSHHQNHFLEENDLVKVLGHGSSAVVYASIPTEEANQILAGYTNGLSTKKQTCDKLRAALQAEKTS